MIDESLIALLQGREERAALQSSLLARSDSVLQISINVPGLPKRIEGDEAALVRAECLVRESLGQQAAERAVLCNAAGVALILAFTGTNLIELKKIAVMTEEKEPWGRALDIDVITAGHQLSRSDIGLPPRLCLLCKQEAKVCARAQSHPADALRDRVRLLLSMCQSPSFNRSISAR